MVKSQLGNASTIFQFKFELSKPTDVYFIFHKDYDGGYQEIIPNLDGWTLCDEAPQYDVFRPIHKDPTHGMGLVSKSDKETLDLDK